LFDSSDLTLEVCLTNSFGPQGFFKVLLAFLFAQSFLLVSNSTLTFLK
jgi:hypothetical protein